MADINMSDKNLTNLPYVPLYPFNQTDQPTGGNSVTQNLNIYYESGDIAWLLASTALVLLMIPGVGYVWRASSCSVADHV